MNDLNVETQSMLLKLARAAIYCRLERGITLTPAMSAYSASAHRPLACFVTLNKHDRLRGCIGTLEPKGPLFQAVAHYAEAAAFHDRRFRPVAIDEMQDIVIHISVLSETEPMPKMPDETTLLSHLRPGVDGLVLQHPQGGATFLPSVWEQLPDPATFLAHLKVKAGFSPDFWSDKLSFHRYYTFSFSEAEALAGESGTAG